MSHGGRLHARIHRLRSEINSLIESLIEEPKRTSAGWEPAVDLVDFPDRVEIHVDLPGVVASELELSLNAQLLRISGRKTRLESEPPARRFHLMERHIGPFDTTVELPCAVRPDSASARLAGGVLSITLRKVIDQRARTYRIPVQENDEAHD